MRKIYKVIGSMLAAGVLVAGIGSGVAFAEYSSFEYGGEAMLEGSEHFTKTVEYKVSEKTDILNVMTDVHDNYYHCYTVVEDDAVSKDRIQVMVSYLSDYKEVVPKVQEVQIQGEDSENMDESIDTESTESLEETTESMNAGTTTTEFMDVESEQEEETTESTQVESKTLQEKSKNLDKAYEYIYVDCDYKYDDFRNIMRAKDRVLSDLKNHKLSDYQLDRVEKIEIHVNPKADFTVWLGENNMGY